MDEITNIKIVSATLQCQPNRVCLPSLKLYEFLLYIKGCLNRWSRHTQKRNKTGLIILNGFIWAYFFHAFHGVFIEQMTLLS